MSLVIRGLFLVNNVRRKINTFSTIGICSGFK